MVITKITMSTSFREVHYLKREKETKQLRRKWLRNWKESIMLCYRWLVFGSFILLLSNLRAIELRGRELPVQEIDGVWRRWGGLPAVVLWILQWIHLNTLEKRVKGWKTGSAWMPSNTLHKAQEKLGKATRILCFPEERLCFLVSGLRSFSKCL